MNKREFDNIQIRRFQVHKFISDNLECTAKEVSLGVEYNLQSVQARIKELESQGAVLRKKNKCASGSVFKSLMDPIPVNKFDRKPATTMPSMLLGSLWMPGHLELG
jgi:hypothetical protein